jgi:hypothetical protein
MCDNTINVENAMTSIMIKNKPKELYNDVLNDLQDYILDDNLIQRAIKNNIANVSINIEKNSKNRQSNKEDKPIQSIQYEKNMNDKSIVKDNKPSFFIPKEKDTLFWCFFIMKNHDNNKYETFYSKNEVITSQLKIEYIECCRKEKQLVKTYKFDSLTNIESNLVNDKILNIKTFLTLCAIENINVIVINNKTYYELLMNDTNNIYIVRSLENKNKGQYEKKYGFELVTKNYADEKLKPELYRVDNIDKPIKAISAYKSSDLVDICNKLGVDIEQRKLKLKKDLYEAILQFF